MVALHAAWLVELWWFAAGRPVNLVLLAAYIGLQVLRLWVLATLGSRWTTRIIVLPGASLVEAGPYRFLSHPNYVVVVCEIALLPLMFGLVWYAAAVLGIECRCTGGSHSRGECSARTRGHARSSGGRAMTVAAVPDETRVPVATWLGFAAMCLGMFMAVLDIQVVATSLPTIRSALDISADSMSWVQTAYLIAEVIAIPLTGLLTRASPCGCCLRPRSGYSRSLRWAVRSAPGFAALIGWRLVQGFSGGMLIPLVFAAVFLLFPFRSQGFATTLAGHARRAGADASGRWSVAGLRRPTPGTGCSWSMSPPAFSRF